MSVRVKVLAILVSAVILIFAGLYLSAQFIFVGNVIEQESKDVDGSMERVGKLITRDIGYLSSICEDWAVWDDAYYFMNGSSNDFIDRNLMNSTIDNLRLNLILFVDINGQVKFSKGYDYRLKKVRDLPQEFISMAGSKNAVLNHKGNDDKRLGLMWVDSTPMMIVCHPITTSDSQEPMNGYLLMGREIDSKYLEELSGIIGAQIKLNNINFAANKIIDIQDIHNKEFKLESTEKAIDKKNISGKTKLKDIHGDNVLSVEIIKPRSIYMDGIRSFYVFLAVFAVICVVVICFVLYFCEKTLLKRLEHLNGFINEVAATDATYSSIVMNGRDEILNLANSVNSMLYKIDKSKKETIKNEERLKLVIESTDDGYWDFDINTGNIYISQHLASMIEYSGDLNTNIDVLRNIVTSETINKMIKQYESGEQNRDSIFEMDNRITLITGKIKWFLIKGKIVEKDSNGKGIRATGIVADITERKKSEEAIRYLSYHDSLTGLYNRAYLNKCLDSLSDNCPLPLSIIMVDANGLKITNDAFGHKEGDKLLIQISNILRQVCHKSDTIARLGGDEFVIILPGASEEEAEIICRKIKGLCERAENYIIKPSVALGIATKNNVDEDIERLIDIAEERMYTNKLLETKSARHSIVASLERSLLETDYETREHAKRLQYLSMKMGKDLNLTNSQLDELSLLSTLHDIGKIAIPTDILMKPSALNDKEWEIIKSHTEIGYRIALSSIELGAIASSILYHHEKWNGAGYPSGLKGEEIPLYARIIAIIDAYDVITHSRPYKQAMSHSEGIEEIKRCSGSHFDPNLVEVFVSMMSNMSEEDVLLLKAI